MPDEKKTSEGREFVLFFDQCSEQIALGGPHDMDVVTVS